MSRPLAAVLAVAVALAVTIAVACRRSPPPPVTLRALYGLTAPAALDPATTALVLIDFQDELFGGRLPVEGGAAALAHAVRLRAWARAAGIRVVYVRQVAARTDSPVFAPGAPGTAIVAALAPGPGEVVVTKASAGAFSSPAFEPLLRAHGVRTLIVAGVMTHLAVDVTVRDAAVRGLAVVVAHDACATRALPSPLDGGVVPAAEVHRAALAALADRFADVRATDALIRLPLARGPRAVGG